MSCHLTSPLECDSDCLKNMSSMWVEVIFCVDPEGGSTQAWELIVLALFPPFSCTQWQYSHYLLCCSCFLVTSMNIRYILHRDVHATMLNQTPWILDPQCAGTRHWTIGRQCFSFPVKSGFEGGEWPQVHIIGMDESRRSSSVETAKYRILTIVTIQY